LRYKPTAACTYCKGGFSQKLRIGCCEALHIILEEAQVEDSTQRAPPALALRVELGQAVNSGLGDEGQGYNALLGRPPDAGHCH
jgi:hypothetical protein